MFEKVQEIEKNKYENKKNQECKIGNNLFIYGDFFREYSKDRDNDFKFIETLKSSTIEGIDKIIKSYCFKKGNDVGETILNQRRKALDSLIDKSIKNNHETSMI